MEPVAIEGELASALIEQNVGTGHGHVVARCLDVRHRSRISMGAPKTAKPQIKDTAHCASRQSCRSESGSVNARKTIQGLGSLKDGQAESRCPP